MIFSTIASIITATLVGFGGVFGTVGAASGLAVALGYVGAAVIYGGVAIGLTATAKALTSKSFTASSPTYANGTIQTQTNQDLPIPLLYGTTKLAGNRVWQDENGTQTVKRIVAFAEGEITEYTDIRLNDKPANEINGCSINRYYGTTEQIIDGIVGGNSQTERAEKVGSLKNLAYLAISVPRSNDIDINYNLTSIVKGRKIRVYSTTTQYEVKYSENPAWVMFDFLTTYNGLGLALNNDGMVSDEIIAELFDLTSFIEAAAYCDEEIEYTDNDGNIKTYPRFTFNMIFDSQTSARDLIDEIFRSCRGGLFTKNGKLQFKIDKAEAISKVFTANDIVKGSETFQTIPSEEHYDILKLVYISPEHEWQKVEAFAEIPEYRDGVPIEHSVNCYSVTNFQQASRLAWYYVNSKVLCPYFGSFKTDYRAYDLEVGDVIKFDSLLMGLDNYQVKVTSVIDDGAGTYTVNWRTYDERLYNDDLGSKEPKLLVSNLSDSYAYPDDVQGFNVVQSQNYLNFVWQFNTNPKDTYELRYGDSWETGTIIGKKINDNKFSWEIPQSGKLYRFWIKAFNNYNYSEHAILDVIQVDNIPTVNEVLKFDLFDKLDGTYINTHFYKRPFRAIKLNTNVKWQTLDEKWTNDNKYYETNGKWGAKTCTEGTYISQVYDIGSNLKSIVNFEISYECINIYQYITPEWRYSTDGITWSDWLLGNIGEYQFRYCQFRAVFHAENGAQMFLKSYKVVIDVPDKELEMDVEIPDSGSLTINYNFINKPSIIGTVNDDIEAYIVVPDSTKTNKTAIIKAFKNDGSLTGAKVNLRIKGY